MLLKKEYYNKISTAFLILFSFFASYAISEYLFGSNLVYNKYGIINIITFITCIYFSKHRKRLELLNKIITICFSLLSATIIVVGNKMYRYDSGGSLISNIIFILGLGYIIYLLFERLVYWYTKYEIDNNKKEEKKWVSLLFSNKLHSLLIVWLLIFLCWLPVWLSFFPGILSYDFPYYYSIFKNDRPMNDSHTIGHTLFFNMSFGMGYNIQSSIIAYSIIQMAIISFIFSFTIFYLTKLNSLLLIRIIALIWYSISPLNAIYSFYMVKDVIFGGLLTIITLILLDLAKNHQLFFKNYFKQVFFSFLLIVFCLFRHSGLYTDFYHNILFNSLFSLLEKYGMHFCFRNNNCLHNYSSIKNIFRLERCVWRQPWN